MFDTKTVQCFNCLRFKPHDCSENPDNCSMARLSENGKFACKTRQSEGTRKYPTLI